MDALRQSGAAPDADGAELWRRLVFSILISNTDDYWRNHGFLFAVPEGWRVSPVYDVNPLPVEVKERILTTAKQNRQSARRKRSMKLSSNSRCPALSKAQITHG